MVEWVKFGTLRGLGYVIRMNRDDFVKRVHECKIKEGAIKGKPPGKWINMVDEHLNELAGEIFNVLKRSAEQGKFEAPLLWPTPLGKFP